MIPKSILLGTVLSFALGPPALAAKPGGVVDGSIDQVVIVTGNVNVSAKGLGAEATSVIGSIDGVEVSGSLSQVVIVGSSYTRASGLVSDAETRIGTIEDSKVSGRVNRLISVGSVTTKSRSLGTSATTKIGTIDDATLTGGFDQTIIVGEVVTDARTLGKSATTCIGTIKGGRRSAVPSLVTGNVTTRTKNGSFLGINTGPVGGKSRSTMIGADGC